MSSITIRPVGRPDQDQVLTLLLPRDGSAGHAEDELIDIGHLVAAIATLARDGDDHSLICHLAEVVEIRIRLLQRWLGLCR